jgi:hypothetical protein
MQDHAPNPFAPRAILYRFTLKHNNISFNFFVLRGIHFV